MTTVAVEATPSIWTRAASRLSNWGTKIVGFFKKVGRWFADRTKWLWNTKPVLWTVSKVQFVAGKVWLGLNVAFHYSKGPILWIGTPVLAFWAMPTTATVILAVGVLALAVIAFFTWRGYRHLRSISSHEELVELIDRLERVGPEHKYSRDQDVPMSFDDEPVAGETVAARLTYLDEMQKKAQENSDRHRFSETQARMNLLIVRRGDVSKIKADATPSAVHRYGRGMAEQMDPDFEWNWDLMSRATSNESGRLKTLEKNLGQLTPVK